MASVLTPTFTTFLILFELALQGRQLSREADEARTDLARQVLESDASLLRSSSLLRHQERRIAIDAERQSREQGKASEVHDRPPQRTVNFSVVSL